MVVEIDYLCKVKIDGYFVCIELLIYYICYLWIWFIYKLCYGICMFGIWDNLIILRNKFVYMIYRFWDLDYVLLYNVFFCMYNWINNNLMINY